MTDNVHTCKVSGCNKPAAVEVYWRDEYFTPRVSHYEPYSKCRYICEEHLQINESGRVGDIEPRGIAAYPYVNRNAMDQGWCEYQWLHNGERVDRATVPHVHVDPSLMPPPILNAQTSRTLAELIDWFRQHCIELGKRFTATAR